jgi:hypothetical protein
MIAYATWWWETDEYRDANLDDMFSAKETAIESVEKIFKQDNILGVQVLKVDITENGSEILGEVFRKEKENTIE